MTLLIALLLLESLGMLDVYTCLGTVFLWLIRAILMLMGGS